MTSLSTRYLTGLAFTTGLVTLAAELSASRLLAPFFGSSLVVWTSLIGLILLALAGGAALGGKLADRHAGPLPLLHWNLAAAIGIGLVPLIAQPILGFAQAALGGEMVGLLLGTFFGTVLLMGIPMVLLGGVVPWCLRLAAVEVKALGALAGRLSACATLGSFIGTFLPVMLLIPALGTRRTYFTLALLLVLWVMLGYRRVRHTRGLVASAVAAAVLLVGIAWPPPAIKGGEDVLEEVESAYQYLRVEEDAMGWRRLRINEGIVSHSKMHPDFALTFGAWDYVALAPYLGEADQQSASGSRHWAILGAGAGTTARLVRTLYPGDRVTGVELDEAILEIGTRWFEGEHPDYRRVAMDARGWLKGTEGPFDVVVVDAYRQPYIPFELTTLEFFREVDRILAPGGTVAINVASPRDDRALLEVLAATAGVVFPGRVAVDLRAPSQAVILYLSRERRSASDMETRLETAEGLAGGLYPSVRGRFFDTFEPATVYTDDHAPVERLMDWMFLQEIQRVAAE